MAFGASPVLRSQADLMESVPAGARLPVRVLPRAGVFANLNVYRGKGGGRSALFVREQELIVVGHPDFMPDGCRQSASRPPLVNC